MKTFLAWLLWIWISLVIVGAFFYAPVAENFRVPGSSRIVFFHVPMAWSSFLGFIGAAVWSLRYLLRRDPRHDRAAAVAIQLGLLFGVLATVTGAVWARIEWGAWWNWDPRQTSILASLLFYAAYLALRQSVDDPEKRGRLAAAYAMLGLVVTPFLFWIVPRITFSLHPEPVVNASGKVEMDPRIQHVLYSSGLGFAALFFWVHNLECRIQALSERKSAP
ncbi:MAG TPA: cytochrome c biogenesis protein CcsA [Thermoanaerobaculia bacterium]|jgi:heme exporter protein C|nr:cytochrome c biogenesis protein CcsA [Thermoanaerobaculia bacterium]